MTEGGQWEQSKFITSCRSLEEELQECSKQRGVGLADGVETLGMDLGARKKVGSNGKATGAKCDVRFTIAYRRIT